MSEVKWIKITTDMFDNRKIKHIRKLPEGNNIILIWVMLLSLAGRCNASGMIFLTENIPYTNKMLSDELGFEESVICMALNTLEQFGMIARDENMLISINNWDEYQNVDGMDRIREQTRKRVSEYRDRKKIEKLKCNNGYDIVKESSTGCNDNCDISKNKFSASKSNLENVNIDLNVHPEYQYILDRKELSDCIMEWMAYKDEKKPKKSNHYDSERGIKMLLNKFVEYDKKYGTRSVVDAVNYAISNNYQGIVWDKLVKDEIRHKRLPSDTQKDLIKSEGLSIEEQIRLLESNSTGF